ncbi:class I SAM-dependent methyltransferase [Streptomyces sp. NPDC020794]|uniref:class I SAM-dependent methyltransferase n=1 Tax=unclassified Streptomyces TaxID=2593676 RepID=UPI0036E6F26A
MTYLSPLGYLLGIEGAALLRGFREGSADREFVEARIAEIRALLGTPALAHAEGAMASPGTISTADVYQAWAPHYDAPGNQMIDIEQPVVRRIMDSLPVGTALDAACGTGRHTTYLHELGHDVIGVDASPDMLAQARKRLPDGEFHEADLHRLPLPDNTVDTVVCALALTHVPELAPVLAEFARVLRPRGHLVISDAHLLASYLRPTLARRPGPDGRPSLLAEYHRPLSAYLVAALPWASRSVTARNPAARTTPSTPTPPRTHSRPTYPGTCCTGARKRRPRPWTIPRLWLSGTSDSTAARRPEQPDQINCDGVRHPLLQDHITRDSQHPQVSTELVAAGHRSDPGPDPLGRDKSGRCTEVEPEPPRVGRPGHGPPQRRWRPAAGSPRRW